MTAKELVLLLDKAINLLEDSNRELIKDMDSRQQKSIERLFRNDEEDEEQ